jgi:hypothetical protein
MLRKGTAMTAYRTRIPRGYRVDKRGRLVRCMKHLDVSTRLKKQASRKVRVARKTAPR